MKENTIDALGGSAKVAKLLGIHQNKGGISRVCNWRGRGIPAKVLVDNPKLFNAIKKLEKQSA